ncbi:hypothetical protein RHMOL_Rhmol10G0139100 [Rhododendron molle]|nr:hypothetical protein RHMOL_Rhmol10G0139100 [Rhododendron molle]
MEAILIDCVQNSLRHFLHQNAIFMCERLCAEFPSETNLQLLAGCYLHNNQAYAAYHVLKGTQMAQSRYLFAISCFQMDLLSEAEASLSPVTDPTAEVPNGAAGHYLLGLIYRYTDRRKSAVHHFKQALSIDPLLWAAYEELCLLGAAEEASTVFGEVAALCIQKQQLNKALAYQNTQPSSDDHSLVSGRNIGLEDSSPREARHMSGNDIRVIPGNYHGVVTSGGVASQSLNGGPGNMSFYSTPSPMAAQLSGVAPPPLCKNVQPNGPNPNAVIMDGSPRSIVNSTIQAPRRKFVDEGKLRKISGRLFSDSGPRRSTRLAAETSVSTNSNATTVTGNGTSHSSKYIGGSKLSSVTFRSVTVRKGQPWTSESFDEGIRHEVRDDSRSNAATSSSSPAGDLSFHDQEETAMPMGGVVMSSSRIITGTSEILDLLRTLGEGYRLSCMYRCQDALDAYLKLPHKHYNTGWVLSQVGKSYFELVDYQEAHRAFSLARLASPYSLEGMDIHSTVLYYFEQRDVHETHSTRLKPSTPLVRGNCNIAQGLLSNGMDRVSSPRVGFLGFLKHLKEDMKLSYLAQELISTDRLAPQS